MNRYDSYKDSGVEVIGIVPSHWKKSKFKFNHTESDHRVENNWTDFQLLSLTKQGVIIRDIESGKGKFPESFETYKKVENGELIFCLYDIEETPRTVGLSNLKGMITGSYKIFRTIDVLPKFTYYTFLSIDDVKGLKPYYTGLRNVVRPETFKSLPFHYPPLSEQLQIVSYLDTKTSHIDTLIEKTQRKIQLLKENRTSLINEVVTKGLNPNVEMKDSGVEWIGEIPSGWNSTPLKRLVTICNGKDYKHIEVEEGGFPVLGTGGVFSRCSEYLHTGPSVLLGRKGTIDNPLFIEEPFWTSDTIYYTDISEDKVLPKLLYHLVHQIPFKLYSYGSAIPSMTKTHYEEMRFPIPPLPEQTEIVSYLDEHTQLIDKTISVEQRRIDTLKEYRQSLISEVVTGKRKVVD